MGNEKNTVMELIDGMKEGKKRDTVEERRKQIEEEMDGLSNWKDEVKNR